MADYSGYLSPFSWRYGSAAMRRLWSERHKRELWRKLWVSLAKVESEYGLVTSSQVAELELHAGDIDVEAALAIEAEIRHDLMAEIKTYAAQCPTAGGVIHLGATSMDIEDNADALRLKEALDLVLAALDSLLLDLAAAIERWADLPVMAFTHLQPAEPTSFGYRCAVWAQDLMLARGDLAAVRDSLKGKGFKGAVGSMASYAELIGLDNLRGFERRLEEELGLQFFPVATQTYTRLQDYRVLSALAGLGAALHKMAFDLRILQSPPIGEVAEPFGKKQVGSSAMPFKRNPIDAEKIDSLSRLLAGYPQTAWSNAALNLLERTLDDSANRRTILPEAFLAADELLNTARKVISGLNVDEDAAGRTYERYAPFACTERVLMAMGKAGADRQDVHEKLREHALAAWAEVKSGLENRLSDRLAADAFFSDVLGREELALLMDISGYLGDTPARARELAHAIRKQTSGGVGERRSP